MDISARAARNLVGPRTLLVNEANAPALDQDALCPRCRGPMGPYRYATVNFANGLVDVKRPSWKCLRCKLEVVSVTGAGREVASVKPDKAS